MSKYYFQLPDDCQQVAGLNLVPDGSKKPSHYITADAAMQAVSDSAFFQKLAHEWEERFNSERRRIDRLMKALAAEMTESK